MYKSQRIIFLLAITFAPIIYSCQGATVATPSVKQVVSQNDIFEDWLLRAENFKGSLSVDVKPVNLKVSDIPSDLTKRHSVSLLVTIRNISPDPIVIKNPITMGINGTGGNDNDLTIAITRKDGWKLSVGDVSNYPERLAVRNIPPLTEKDFKLLKSGETLPVPVDMELPFVFIENEHKSGNLPTGQYLLTAMYGNGDVGYILPLKTTPSATFTNLQQEDEWHFENTMIADLNAWIGLVQSNPIEFEIP